MTQRAYGLTQITFGQVQLFHVECDLANGLLGLFCLLCDALNLGDEGVDAGLTGLQRALAIDLVLVTLANVALDFSVKNFDFRLNLLDYFVNAIQALFVWENLIDIKSVLL